MKFRISNLYNVAAASLMSLLGFSSCDGVGGDEPCLYRTPRSTYNIKGKVIDTDGKPINGIKVQAGKMYDEYGEPMIEPVYTNEDGEYTTTIKDAYMPVSSLEMVFEDVDGEENGGAFANDTIRGKDMTAKKVADGIDFWDTGTYEVTANKTLKKK